MTKTLQPEDIIAQYRVVGPLGAGGMGEVYLAQDQTLERNVALKVLPPDLVRSEDRVRRFVQEAKSASSLNHPNIVTIYEIGSDKVKSSSGSESGPLQFISMELVSGKTLGAKIHEEKTDLRTLLGYLAQAAEGIAKAHAAGIVHRDLKPGNIMVSDDGFTKVLDFGLAKLTEKRSGVGVGDGDDRSRGPDQRGCGPRDRPLHVARAGAGQSRRPPLGYLLVRLSPVRSRHAPSSVRRGFERRDDAQDSRTRSPRRSKS